MTHKVFIKQADMRRMAAVAKEYGIRVEVEADGLILRFAPNSPNNTVHDGEPATLEEWQTRRYRDRALLAPLGKSSHKRGLNRGPKT